MVSRTRAGYVQKVPLGVVDIFEVCIVGDGLNAFLQGDYFVVLSSEGDTL